MPSAIGLIAARAKIREHGWFVQAVSDLGCCTCDQEHISAGPSGEDPYLYTVGLTAAGLPELLLRLPCRNSMEWLRLGHQVLNLIAAHTLHKELTVGESIPIAIGHELASALIQEPPVFSTEDNGVWLGYAFAIYGRDRVSCLEIVPDWTS